MSPQTISILTQNLIPFVCKNCVEMVNCFRCIFEQNYMKKGYLGLFLEPLHQVHAQHHRAKAKHELNDQVGDEPNQRFIAQ